MNLPILERIALNLIDTLKGISVQAGYLNDVQVQRMNLKRGTSYRDRMILVMTGSAERLDDQESVGFLHWEQSFLLTCFVQESDQSQMSLDERVNAIRADVERAVMLDYTRGGYALDTDLGDIIRMPVEAGTGMSGVVIEVLVQYRTSRLDPTSQIGS